MQSFSWWNRSVKIEKFVNTWQFLEGNLKTWSKIENLCPTHPKSIGGMGSVFKSKEVKRMKQKIL